MSFFFYKLDEICYYHGIVADYSIPLLALHHAGILHQVLALISTHFTRVLYTFPSRTHTKNKLCSMHNFTEKNWVSYPQNS
jgi:hypothetical protein